MEDVRKITALVDSLSHTTGWPVVRVVLTDLLERWLELFNEEEP